MGVKCGNVLLVDDDPFVREMLGDILESKGYVVETASDGAEALTRLSHISDIELVFSDINMPVMSGLELIRRVRAGGSDMPIIILTGNRELSVAVDAINSGADDYLIKDENIQDTAVLAAERVLARHRLKKRNELLTADLVVKNKKLEDFNKTLETIIHKLTNIGTSLGSEKDLRKLLELIVFEVMEVSHADGVTLYSIAGGQLHFEIVVNRSLKRFMGGFSGDAIAFPPMPMVESNVSAWCAVKNEIVAIPDVYTSDRFDFIGPREFDEATGYRTKSMLVLPVTDRNGRVVGVLQLINSIDPQTGEVVSFEGNIVDVAFSVACQAGVCIENARNYEQIERKKLAFERFVPTEFLVYMGKAEVEDIILGDAVSGELSVMFSDIRSFTSISEKMTPAESLTFLNAYLGVIGPAIERNGGFIDKYIGDAVMALFAGAKVAVADDAVLAAIAMQRRLKEFNLSNSLLSPSSDPIRIGVGIHTGPLTLGTVGFHSRMDSTVIGDTVNLASRVEELTKTYDVEVAITSDVLIQLKDPTDFLIREIDTVKVRGKDRPVTIYEVFDSNDDETRKNKERTLGSYNEGLRLFKLKRHDDALPIFRELQAGFGSDLAISIYADRCLAACTN
jgi:class 3 adenylate cyclase/DNA-binding NarL/FixJ family response regulator